MVIGGIVLYVWENFKVIYELYVCTGRKVDHKFNKYKSITVNKGKNTVTVSMLTKDKLFSY